MTTLSEIDASGRVRLSFELFPPKTPAGERALYSHVEQLMQFHPAFVTCTYGAGGSTREKTLDIVQHVRQTFNVPVASHLTCVGSTADQLREYLREAAARGVDAIVALRGDPPQGQRDFQTVEGGLRYANELVALIRAEFPDFGVAVAGYPEKHVEAPSMEVDLRNLKRKVDTGADLVVTQLFYNNEDFFRFRDRCGELGIRVPVVPGILPVTSLSQVQRITSMCGARLQDEFVQRLQDRDDPEWQFEVGVEYATRQIAGLLDNGVQWVHFYVLNKSQATSRVLTELSLR